MRLKKILVTTDFSDLSRQAFRGAASVARKFEAELHLVHVLEALPAILFVNEAGTVGYSPEADYRLKFQELLERTAEGEPSFRGLAVKTHLLESGHVHERLVKFEKQHSIDLVVISTHGRSGPGHLFLGSFAEKVVRLSSSPVLTYRLPREGQGSEPFEPRRILVPLDLSENDRATVEAARVLAETYKAHVRLQHVFMTGRDLALLPEAAMAAEYWVKATEELKEEAERRLRDIIQHELPPPIAADAVAEPGVPYLEILEQAEEFRADLIILSTHGRTGVGHALLGSVAEKVVRKAPCSVLTLRPAAGEGAVA